MSSGSRIAGIDRARGALKLALIIDRAAEMAAGYADGGAGAR
jgi:hypothetical protein